MNLPEQRQEIAAALSTVDGVTGSPYRPRLLDTGAAWPMLQALERDQVPDLDVTWRVAVVLPADEETAAVWFDAHVEPLDDALSEVGWVSRFEPTTLRTNGGDLTVIMISMRREA